MYIETVRTYVCVYVSWSAVGKLQREAETKKIKGKHTGTQKKQTKTVDERKLRAL